MSEHDTSSCEHESEAFNSSDNSQRVKKGSVKQKKSKSIYKRKVISPVVTGAFWIVVGLAMLLVNFFSENTSLSLILFIRYWGMLLAGIYVVLFSLLGYMRKVYFIVGVCAVALWLGHVIQSSSTINTKIMWSIIMVIMSVSIILYGIVFKKHKLKSYIVAGSMFLAFSLLVFISVLQSFNLSEFLKKGWPVFLVFLGVSYMYNRKRVSKRTDSESCGTNDSEGS